MAPATREIPAYNKLPAKACRKSRREGLTVLIGALRIGLITSLPSARIGYSHIDHCGEPCDCGSGSAAAPVGWLFCIIWR